MNRVCAQVLRVSKDRRKNDMFNLLTAAEGTGGGSILILVMYVVLIGGFMYFFVMRPQNKEKKRMTAMWESVEVGDTIVTTGGFYGVVIAVEGDDCIVEFGSNRNCRIPMRKAAIAEVEKAGGNGAEAK